MFLTYLMASAAAIPRRSPYLSFRSIPLAIPQWEDGTVIGSSAPANTQHFVEIPKLNGPDFTGQPLDYGSSLNFAGPLSSEPAKLKVRDGVQSNRPTHFLR